MKATRIGKYCVHLDDGTSWPRLGTDLEWRARYSPEAGRGESSETTSLCLSLASVVAAFEALVWKPERRRNEIIRALREAAAEHPAESNE